jgi:hypothetical protein
MLQPPIARIDEVMVAQTLPADSGCAWSFENPGETMGGYYRGFYHEANDAGSPSAGSRRASAISRRPPHRLALLCGPCPVPVSGTDSPPPHLCRYHRSFAQNA